LRNQATPVFAPKLPPLIVPPPIVTATQPARGDAAQTGASDRAGPGQGAGGTGNGTGGGGTGGNGDDIAVGPHQIKGKLSFKDLPEGMLKPGGGASVGVRYAVNVDGTVSDCFADEPSGLPQLDALACRLIEQRFRYRPARDRAGRPVRSIVAESHSWFMREEKGRPSG
jgi:protein TonB